jgi:cysteine-rich repeat protein
MRRTDVRSALLGVGLALLLSTPAAAVIGDCNGSGEVEINDLITAINVSLGDTPLEACRGVDSNGDGIVAVDEVVVAVLYGLGSLPHADVLCGNNHVEPDEDCDDGNLDNGDGCSSDCQFEGIGVLDQHWSGRRGSSCGGFLGSGNLGLLGPFAQEFVPQLSAVTTVLVDAAGASDQPASALRLNIRRATFDGPLLGWTSARVTDLESSSRQNWVRFDLPAPVAVTPGEVYVFELVGYDDNVSIVSGGGDVGCTERTYRPGDPVTHGERTTDTDFLFGIFGTNAPGVGAVDQAWLGPQGICGTFGSSAGPADHVLVQTFRPTIDAVGAVAVQLLSIGGGAAPAGTLTLRVREGGPAGRVLATVQRFIAAPNDGEAWYVFPFAPALPVTPGARYAIELTDEVDRFLWLTETGLAEAACVEPEFGGGAAYVDGRPLGTYAFPFAVYAPR